MIKITAHQASLLYKTLYGEKTNQTILKEIFSEVWSTSDGVHLIHHTVFLRAARLLISIENKKPFASHNTQMGLLLSLSLLSVNGKPVSTSKETIDSILSLLGERDADKDISRLADLLSRVATEETLPAKE